MSYENIGDAIGCPAHVEVLMHCHCSCEPLREAPVVETAARMLLKNGAIEIVDKNFNPMALTTDELMKSGEHFYHTTPRGRAWVKAICEVKAPRAVYIDESGRALSPD